MVYGYHSILEILKLAARKGVKRSTFPKKGLRWSGKAKDYPGAKEIANMNRQGIYRKQKPKLRIV